MIKIKIEKEVKDDVLGYRVLNIKALKAEQLPIQYLQNVPKTWLSKDGKRLIIKIYNKGSSSYTIFNLQINHFYSKKQFIILINHILEAGKALQRINKTIKQRNAMCWKGTSTIII